ncbi:MAG: hypothetical protein JRN21_09535 [Nitrososphaerota archaeon]|nr:hypothetical protein [Nitrososphaerota archaeon]
MKIYNVNDIYKALKVAISKQSKGSTKLAGLDEFCASNNLNYKSASLLIETMGNLHPDLVDLVVISRGGNSKNFVQSLASRLHVSTISPTLSSRSFVIPYSFARFIARLDSDDQITFVNRWKDNGLDVNFASLEALTARSKIDGFEFAYQQTFTTYAQRLEIQQAALIRAAGARGSDLVDELIKSGYDANIVTATVNALTYAGILKRDNKHNDYELGDKAHDIFERAFKGQPYNAMAIWLSTMFSDIGILRVTSNKYKMKQILKAVREKLEYYEKQVDAKVPIPNLKK